MNEEKIKDMFDRRAASYDSEKLSSLRKLFGKIVLQEAQIKNTDVVLDIGTGTGELAISAARSAKKVIGIDISDKMINVAKSKSEEISNLSFRVGSFLNPNTKKGCADVIISSFAFHHLSDEEKNKGISVMYDILKPAGRVVIGDVMYFIDPKTNLEQIKKEIRMFVPDLNYYLSQLKTENPTTAENLKHLFRKNKFKVEKTIPILSMIGIIKAMK